ncbi:MAG: hypothetical protein ACR2RV_03610 [Verrucomicrobiales bacterium]
METATSFVRAYLEAYEISAGLEGYFELVEPEAEFLHRMNRWNVFFTDGVNSINVELDVDANRGGIHLFDGTAFTNDPDRKGEFHPDPIPLFSLSQFRRVLKDHIDEGGAPE